MNGNLPNSVRYVKNGRGGQWWRAAKDNGQIHLGWRTIPGALLLAADLGAIERLIRSEFGPKRGATQDFNALRTLLDRPSQHVWVTFQDGCLWWCTTTDSIEINPDNETIDRGHFWLSCASPWSNYSLDGSRHLVSAELPGIVAMLAGYQATVCEPSSSIEILRIIKNEEDEDVRTATLARDAYQSAVEKLISRLRDKDFELLIDLILSRSGWNRLAKLGGSTEGIDVEVENPATGEIAFVQVKSVADQTTLDDYVSRFNDRRSRYHRMIFAVHKPRTNLNPPHDTQVSIWKRDQISQLAVRLGLGDWIFRRF